MLWEGQVRGIGVGCSWGRQLTLDPFLTLMVSPDAEALGPWCLPAAPQSPGWAVRKDAQSNTLEFHSPPPISPFHVTFYSVICHVRVSSMEKPGIGGKY